MNNKFIATINPFRYRGYYFDTETNLYYLNSRYYDPEIGRFINADSIKYLESKSFNGLNLYTYCVNNPIMLTDPDGNKFFSNLWRGIKSAFKKVGNFIASNWDVIVGTVISVGLIIGGIAITILSGGTLSVLGGTLIGAGFNSLANGIQSKIDGNSFWSGYVGGLVTGTLTGLGAYFGPLGVLGFAAAGNFAGTIITDSINGVDVADGNYLLNNFANSILYGLTAVGAYKFCNFIGMFNVEGLKSAFAALTIWAQFASGALFENAKTFIYKLVNNEIFLI